MDDKYGFLNVLKIFSIVFSLYFLLNFLYNGNWYYLLCSCLSPIYGKHLATEIWAEMLSANQMAGLLNQLYLQNKLIKKPDFFLRANTNSQKLNVDGIIFGWAWSKRNLALQAIGLSNLLYIISKVTNLADFCILMIQIQES